MADAGFQLVTALIAWLYGGSWLDRRFGLAPVFLYLGVAVGAVWRDDSAVPATHADAARR
jgi:Putative F0F1-ATPase subunit Ca2+/Mg2+ transporter